MEHSNYSPSRLSRIIKCPGSVKLINDLMVTKTVGPEKSSSYAEHGTHLHKVLDRYKSGGTDEFKQLVKDDQFLIMECVDYLEILIASLGHNNYGIQSECKVDLKSWGIPDVWGHLDYQVYDSIKRHIDVLDWKFGAGVQVYAKENPQMMSYAAGAIGWPTSIQTITLHVVQPAIENFDTYQLTVEELYDWVHGTLAIAINKASSDSEEFNPGVDQCRWCEAKNHCWTRLEFAIETAIELFDAQLSLAKCPTPESLIELIKKGPAVEKAIKDIRLYIQTEMLRGVEFPGLKLVRGRANRKWKDELATIKWLNENTELEDIFNSKLLSPNQIEMLAKPLKKNEKFTDLYETPDGKVTLVHESDRRPAIESTTKAVDVFADYKVPDLSDTKLDKLE